MTENHSPALDLALAYYRAWTGHDFDHAMTYVAPDIVCDAPAGRLEGTDAFRALMGPSRRFLTNSNLIAAFGDQEPRCSCMTPTPSRSRTPPAPNATPFGTGKITHIRIVCRSKPNEGRRRAAGRSLSGRDVLAPGETAHPDRRAAPSLCRRPPVVPERSPWPL